jgi:tetratricopeptide (TPR) repeat protein
MRISLLTLTLFISTTIVGQSNLDKQLSKDFCACFNEIQTPSFNNVEKCFSKALQINQDSLFIAAKSQFGETWKDSANKFIQILLGRITVSFIYSCDAYYKYLDTSRNSIYRDINRDSVRKAIKLINKGNPENGDTSFFIKRGEMYFEVSDLNNALSDFNNALQEDSNSILACYFKAWVLEKKEIILKPIIFVIS